MLSPIKLRICKENRNIFLMLFVTSTWYGSKLMQYDRQCVFRTSEIILFIYIWIQNIHMQYICIPYRKHCYVCKKEILPCSLLREKVYNSNASSFLKFVAIFDYFGFLLNYILLNRMTARGSRHDVWYIKSYLIYVLTYEFDVLMRSLVHPVS